MQRHALIILLITLILPGALVFAQDTKDPETKPTADTAAKTEPAAAKPAPPPPPPFQVDDAKAEKLYQSLFAADERAVTQSRDKNDDLVFATALLATAKSMTDKPTVAALLATKAFDFLMKAGQPALAAEAMDTVIQSMPAGAGDARDKRIKARTLVFKTSPPKNKVVAAFELLGAYLDAAEYNMLSGKATLAAGQLSKALSLMTKLQPKNKPIVKAMHASAQYAMKIEGQIGRLENKLKLAPDDQQATDELTRLFLLERNSRVDAQRLAQGASEAMQKLAASALGPTASLAATDALALGDFYFAHAGKTESVVVRHRALQRAGKAYARYLEAVGEKGGLKTNKAKIALKAIQSQVATYQAEQKSIRTPPPPPEAGS